MAGPGPLALRVSGSLLEAYNMGPELRTGGPFSLNYTVFKSFGQDLRGLFLPLGMASASEPWP